MQDAKKKAEEDVHQMEQLEEVRKKLTRELDAAFNRNEELTAQLEKSEKSRKKMQAEVCVGREKYTKPSQALLMQLDDILIYIYTTIQMYI